MQLKTELTMVALVLVLFTLACAFTGQPTPTQQAEQAIDWPATVQALEVQLQATEEAPAQETSPVYGFWMTESEDPIRNAQILVITEQSFYQFQTFDPMTLNPEARAREMFAEVVEHDEVNGHLTLRTRWFRTNGEFGGFDQPTALVAYRVENGGLFLTLSRVGDGKFPEEVGSIPYYRR